MSGKTEKPTPRRLREARREGQFPRSRTLNAAAVVVSGGVGVCIAFAIAAEEFVAWSSALLSGDASETAAEATRGLHLALKMLAPVLLSALVGALVTTSAAAGLMWNPGHLALKLDRLTIIGGLRRLFSAERLADSLFSLAVPVTVTLAAWSAIGSALRNAWPNGTELQSMRAATLVDALAPVFVRVAVAVGVLGAIEYLWARKRHLRQLAMTRAEVRRELREDEGDPRLKGHRRALHRAALEGGSARGVRNATLVVVNPTHIAVALRFDDREAPAPYVVEKAIEREAPTLRERAARMGIPVFRDVPLARSLIHLDVGEMISPELFYAVAALIHATAPRGDSEGGEQHA